MGRFKEAIDRKLSRPDHKPGLLDLHLALMPVIGVLFTKMIIRIPGNLPTSRLRLSSPGLEEMPTREKDKKGYTLTIPKGSAAGVKIAGEDFLFTSKTRSGRIMRGGKLVERKDGGCHMAGGRIRDVSEKSGPLNLGRNIIVTYEPDF